jgi:hypothetical protein
MPCAVLWHAELPGGMLTPRKGRLPSQLLPSTAADEYIITFTRFKPDRVADIAFALPGSCAQRTPAARAARRLAAPPQLAQLLPSSLVTAGGSQGVTRGSPPPGACASLHGRLTCTWLGVCSAAPQLSRSRPPVVPRPQAPRRPQPAPWLLPLRAVPG